MILSLDRQVTNYELSHDLVEADAAMNTTYFWVRYLDGRITIEPARIAKKQQRFCSAYLSCELGILLPIKTVTYWRVNETGPQWICTYTDKYNDLSPIETQGDTEADARGRMLLKIIKQTTIPKTEFWRHYEN